MERMIAVDQLARPDNIILVPLEAISGARRSGLFADQRDAARGGFPEGAAARNRGRRNAGDGGGGRTLFDFPERHGSFSSIWRGRCGTNRVTPKFS